MAFIQKIGSWLGWGGVTTDRSGQQISTPSYLTSKPTSVDGALQVSTVFSCVRLLAGSVSSLPLMVYEQDEKGRRTLNRNSRLWSVLHDQPNAAMTSSDFWQTMVMQWALRGNAYAQIIRDGDGDLVSLWPMSADQMNVYVNDNGKVVYEYQKDGKTKTLDASEVLHIKDVGTGIVGFSKLEFMSSSIRESSETQRFATANAENSGKPSGILTVDHVLDRKKGQAQAIAASLGSFKEGGASKIIVLEADMKFQQVSLTPEQSQLLETRRYSVEEICRWFGVPPVLIGASGATTWGSGIAEIVSGFHKFTLNPLLKSIEQSLESRILDPESRSKITIEFSLDALLRGDIQSRYSAYAVAVQNGFKTRNEVRQLENDEPLPGGDMLTAQTNLAPLDALGSSTAEQTSQTPIVSEIKQ